MTITALGADVNPLPTTNAAEMTFALSIRDAAGNVSSITENATLGNDSEFLPLSVKSAITMIPQKAINAALTGLQDQLNAFLRSSANVTLLVGFTGTTTGGRADVDMVAKITLSVTFKKCVDGPPTALVSTGSESCLR